MLAKLRPLSDDELSSFIGATLIQYAEQRVESGEEADVARATAIRQTEELIPGGRPAPGQLLYRVLDEGGNPVGTLWIGPRTPDRPRNYWVWDVQIEEPERGKGYGRAAMLLAEVEARRRGATELGLNVFGHNHVARQLYESMGYAPTAINMRKPL
jgi:GNAT superfamily N-acetyltransferase